MRKLFLKWKLVFFISFYLASQNLCAQYTTHFPAEWIDQSIIDARGIQEKIRMLKEDCNWADRKGGKIDVFWLKTEKGNLFGYVYEYIMDCDNLRLIYWFADPGGTGIVVDFMIENLEDESIFVIAKKKQLKNRKAYQKYLVPKEN